MDTHFTPVKKLKTAELEIIYEGKPIDIILFLANNIDPQRLLETGFVWKEINDPVIHPNKNEYMIRGGMHDAVYDIHYSNEWSQGIDSSPCVTDRGIEGFLSSALGDLWNIDAGPMSHIIASYYKSPIWTYYLDWAYLWMAANRNIEVLDLILELAFGDDKLKLLKLPPREAIEQDGWKIAPIILANDMIVDPTNFTKDEPLLSHAAQGSHLSIAPYMINHTVPAGKVYSRIPNIFYPLTLTMSKIWLEQRERKTILRNHWNYSSPDSIIIESGAIYIKHELSYEDYSPDLEEFDYCQLCNDKSAICSKCKFRDLLFCPKHSSMIKCKDAIICDECT
jgi:hypothetical protein